MLTTILLGLAIGVPLGYVMQRTYLCFNSAYREAVLRRRFVLLRAILLAVLIQMASLALIVQFGVGGIQLSVVPYFWLATVLGGFFFGVAMVYAEGCSSTVWYRVGNGNLGSLVSLIGFAVGEALISFGPLGGLRLAIQRYEVTLPGGALPTLPNLLGLNPWLLVIPILLVGGWWLIRSPAGTYLRGWDWRRAGLALGVIGAASWLLAWPTGWHYGVGIVGSTGTWIQALFEGPGVLRWGNFMVLGMPVGAFIAVRSRRGFRWQVPDLPSTVRMTTAGLVMGLSAGLAGGCNIGHGFTGLPTLALSSLTATLFTFLGTWAGNYVRFVRTGRVKRGQ